MTSSSAPRLFLVDAFGLIFRAFYGRARSPVPAMRTTAGVPTEAVFVFTNMLRRMLNDHKPEYLAVVWEGEGPTFRDEQFADYKANRSEMPAELGQQMPYIRRLLTAMQTPVLKKDGYEADDVIGALTRQAAGLEVDVYIISSDKDMMQLVGDRVWFLNPMKDDMVYDAAGVKEFLGVEPSQVIDLLALKGDSIDNIPGAPGIGDKGAQQLIAEYGGVEAALERAGEVKRKTYRESLQNNRDQILLSKKLAAIAVEAPVELDLESLRTAEPDWKALRDLFTELEFHSLLSQLEVPVEQRTTESQTLSGQEDLEAWLAARGDRQVAIWVDLDESDRIYPGGLALSFETGRAALLPSALLEAAKPFLEDPDQPKQAHGGKTALKTLRARGMELQGVRDDSLLAAFLVDASRTDYSLDKAVARKMGVQLDADPCRCADLARQLGSSLAEEVDRLGLREVYERIELPLTPVLAGMEERGVSIDCELLARLSRSMEAEIADRESEIQRIAGREFNVNSTKQLSEILFDELKLPAPPRRGKTRSRSTAADVLEGLAPNYPIAAKILEYREFSKLKSTYVDALPALVNNETGRLHTTFNPTGSATGRLSSSNPNLQNIPIRTELGRRIRAAFVAPEGMQLLAADYSQIELRVLAHVSGDRALQDAFRRGEDIHTRTAAEVFGVAPLMVGPEERRRAKAVNFGIVYGLSPFGLSQQLGISQKEARTYIDAYFELYSGVKKYVDETIAAARRTGSAQTIFGRRRPIPDLDSRNPAARGFAERTAVNSPIQGTAADLIKLAMIQVDRLLREKGSAARMLLQVHDELLFEAPVEEIAALGELVKREMEAVGQLEVPLVADVKTGVNWRDLHPV